MEILRRTEEHYFTSSIIMDKHTTKEANRKADAKLSFRKFIQFDLNTAAITDLATDFFNPEKLTPFYQEHKSPSLPTISLFHTPLTNL
jgi:hypothetical protein